VDDARWSLFTAKQAQKTRLLDALKGHRYSQWLKRPEAKLEEVRAWVAEVLGEVPVRGLLATIETETKYAGYIAQQERQIERLKSAEGRKIPVDFAFRAIPGLSREVGEKLTKVQPATLGQAARIPGVTPAAIAILDVYLSIARVC
jgi:tRNA uridine 5-carboxymethylaminomethyl modification enzyme